MNKALIICFMFVTTIFIGCKNERYCPGNRVWNETTKRCEYAVPTEAALLTQEQCTNDLTKIWDTQNNKCRNRSQNECNADGTKWENNHCVKIQASAGTGTETPGSTESVELYTITNNSSVPITVSALADPSTLPEDGSVRIPPNLLAYIGLRNGECVNVTKDQFTTSLNIKRNISALVCDNFSEGSTKCNDGTPAHLAINNHPTTDGRNYNWVEIAVATAETHNEDCPLLESRN